MFIPEEKACSKIVYKINNTKRTRRRGFWIFTCGRINYFLGCDHRNRKEEVIDSPEQLKDQKQIRLSENDILFFSGLACSFHWYVVVSFSLWLDISYVRFGDKAS